MMKIGPAFHSELVAAGLAGLPFTYHEDGTFLFTTEPSGFVSEPMTQEQVDAVLTVFEAHDPSAEPPDLVPQVVSRYQGREAMWQTPLGDQSLFEAAEALLADPATAPQYKRAWDDLQEFHRDSEMLSVIAATLGLTAAQVDALFILAASIKA